MSLMYILAFFSVILELGLPFLPRKYRYVRILTGSICIGILLAISLYLLQNYIGICIVLICLLCAFRSVNLLRIMKARMNRHYLQQACTRTTIMLVGLQVIVAGVLRLAAEYHYAFDMVWLGVAVMQTLAAAMLLWSVRQHLRHASKLQTALGIRDKDLPSITVAVAARNETETLASCLESIIASDYPKLEILVLDDCSQLRRTPEIIRSFAHDGVRFIPGEEPNTSWLARNQAYDTLAKEANGEYILFCSTSVRLEHDSIRKIASYATAKNKTMVAVMPRYDMRGLRWTLIQSMRSAWELMPPRRLVGRPAVQNTCWIIQKQALRTAGGFSAVSRMITPEVYFARSAAATDSYSFIPGGNYYGVSSTKNPHEQLESTIRSDYPSLHRRPEVVAVVSLGLFICLVGPFAGILLVFLSNQLWLASLLSLLAAGLLLLCYRTVYGLVYGSAPLQRLVVLPAAVLVSIALHHYSMYKYEFSEVLWKDRNVCVPTMHVIPHLPEA